MTNEIYKERRCMMKYLIILLFLVGCGGNDNKTEIIEEPKEEFNFGRLDKAFENESGIGYYISISCEGGYYIKIEQDGLIVNSSPENPTTNKDIFLRLKTKSQVNIEVQDETKNKLSFKVQ